MNFSNESATNIPFYKSFTHYNNISVLQVNKSLSTQDQLIDLNKLYDLPNYFTLWAEEQTQGRGRKAYDWTQGPETLCFSVLLPILQPITLCPLVLGYKIVDHIEKNWNITLKLKWPNDILSLNGQKVGGIICTSSQGKIIVGIGLNLKPHAKYGGIFPEGKSVYQSSLLFDLLYHLSSDYKKVYQDLPVFINSWSEYCIHQNKQVTVTHEGNLTKGIFLGISSIGEAMVKIDDCILSISDASSLQLSNI
jgi:BirA family biotin operon repressor/biotin-[acetyl-CoA-carboxylase] ligase